MSQMREAIKFTAILLNVAREIIRQPLILLLTTVCIVLTSSLPMIVMFDFGEDGKIARDGALAFHFIFGIAMAIAAASIAFHAEIKRGRSSTVLSKPISRPVFLIANYCGIFLVLTLFSLIIIMTGLLSVRMAQPFSIDHHIALLLYGALISAFAAAAIGNAWLKKPFVSHAFLLMIPTMIIALTVASVFMRSGQTMFAEACHLTHCDHTSHTTSSIQWNMIPAGLLIMMALAILASISVALSTRMPPVLTIACCGLIFIGGLISDHLFAAARTESIFAAFFYAVLPNWQNFWMADSLSGDGFLPWRYVIKAGIYAFFYLSGTLCLAIASFQNVD